jgi:hypothetical protein
MLKWSFAVLALFVTPAMADSIIPRGLGHPQGSQTHWYDTGCCSQADCEPVEFGAIRETPEGYAVKYLTSRGFIAEGIVPYGSSGVRPSRDANEHACATRQRVLCVYLPFGS